MSNLIVPDEFKQDNPFILPFRADADMVVDANGRGVAKISDQAGPEEAIRIAKLFASGAESLARLHNLADYLQAMTEGEDGFNHGAEDEDKSECIICYIRDYIDEVLK